MSRAPTLSSIDCTACGAGLDVLGGGRVTTHICPYCGTELDANDGYRALRKFANAARPETPFPLGSRGTIYGVDWTVIGILAHRETYAGQSWEWVDHQLYSPTHGYAWLTVEDGHTTFARKLRGTRASLWMGERWVETAENKPTVSHLGDRFVYLQTSKSRITFAEGEFTWSPKTGEETTTISAMSKDAMLDFSQTGTEQEIHRVTYLDPAETLAAFGVPRTSLSPVGVHALQPYRDWRDRAFLRNTALLSAALAIVAALVLAFLPGQQVMQPRTIELRALPRTVNFDITDPTRRLAGLYFESNVSNSWAYVEIELTDPEGETLFEAGRTIEYYFGRDADGRWTEGSRRGSLYFLPNLPGTYALTLSGPESGIWGNGDAPSFITVSAKSNMSSGFYPALLGAGFLLMAIFLSAGPFLHKQRRWRHSDWSDE